ncbi:MAG: TRAP transporter large permease subunit, partial [Yaniella sp.]|nr:TRAP transporter large permease subunit [Yaniella sp.]
GFFTPTEAAAIGVLYILALGFIYRTLSFKGVLNALRETAVTTGSIMLIIAAASLLGWVLSREQVPQNLADFMTSNISSPILFLLAVNVLLIILGAFIDATAVILITVPVLLPIAVEFGVDPVHFGVIMILNLMIGLLTPPVGSVLFVMSSVLRTPVETVFKGVAPFLIPMVLVLLLLTFVPAIVTFVPNLLGF